MGRDVGSLDLPGGEEDHRGFPQCCSGPEARRFWSAERTANVAVLVEVSIAVARIEGEIMIERPVDVVFDFVADERNEPRYNPQLVSVEQTTSGPIGVGTQFRAETVRVGRTVEVQIDSRRTSDRGDWRQRRTFPRWTSAAT